MQPKAFIFDFDGVIALSEHVHCQAWEDLAKAEGKPLPVGFLEKGVGSSDGELAIELAAFWGFAADHATVLTGKRHYYQQRVATECTLVPGVKAALAACFDMAPVALATSSCRTDITPLMATHGLECYFKTILTVDDVERPKPHPEIYLKAAQRLGVPAEDCWVFEDSIHGTTAARRAGMNIIAITTTFAVEALGEVHGAFPDFLDLVAVKKIFARGQV